MALAFSAPFSIALAQAAAGLVLIFGLWLFIKRHERQPLPTLMTVSLLLFLIVLALSSVFAPEPSRAIPQLKKSWVLLCFFPLVAYGILISPRTIIRYLFWGTVLASLVAMFRFFAQGVERAAPFSGGYTTIALFEAAALPLALALWADSNSRWRWAYALGAIAVAAGLILSGTRAGWLAALLGLVIYGFIANRKAALIGLVVAAAVVFALPQSRRIVLDRFASGRQGGFTTGRLALWTEARQPLSNLPFFGHGPGSFGRLVPERVLSEIGDPGIKSWHSAPLEILIESGPLALLGILGVLITTLGRSWKDYARKRSPLGLALLGALAAIYLASLTTNVFRDFLLMSLLIILWTAIYSPGSNPGADNA